MKGIFYTFCFTLLLCVCWSCKDETPETSLADQERASIEAYLDSMNLSDLAAEDTAGIYAYPITSNPSGKTQNEGTVLSIFYKIAVLGGQTIDVYDSLDGDTIVVRQGADAIFPIGIDRALAYLQEGETWGFVLPSRMAYGAYSYSTLIPENAIILAEISLLKIRSESDVLDEELLAINSYVEDQGLRDTVSNPYNQPQFLPNGIVYKRLAPGSGLSPQADSMVTITYEASYLDGLVVDRAAAASPFEFVMGGAQVISGLEIGVGRMQEGERALVIMPSYLAYKESAQVIPPFPEIYEDLVELEVVPAYSAKVAPYEPLVFEIDLIDVN